MGLRDIGATLPPGFRFNPSDEELVCHYLSKKIANEQVLKPTLVDIDLHKCEPRQLPEVAKLNANEWYFFSFRKRKYATGFRTNRATTSGYWKATGKDRTVVDRRTEEVVGMRKTLVFYKNRIKTGWIMHEFRLYTPHMPPKEEWVLCRVFDKSKEEDNTTHISLMMLETSATHASSLTHPTTYKEINSLSITSPTYQSYPQWLQNMLQDDSNQENNINELNSNVADGYEYLLWDIEENSFRDHHVDRVASDLDDMRFEIDNTMASWGENK